MGCRCHQKGCSCFCLGLDGDFFTLLSVPQPAHRPPTTPSLLPSPDSLRLTYPTNSHHNFFFASFLRLSQLVLSSSDYIPCLQFGTVPPTPSRSDNEFTLPSPWFNPCRTAIKQLVIAGHNGSPSTSPIQRERMPHFRFPLATIKNPMKRLSWSSLSEESFCETHDGEGASDSEWYTREFLNILIPPHP